MPNYDLKIQNKNELQAKPKMSDALASNAVNELFRTLTLTDEQINRAKSSALELSTNPNLKDCDVYSLIKYCAETARYNFSRSDCVYPIPYGNKVQAQVGYKGFRELAMRSNAYKEVSCSLVYDCDTVRRDRETGRVHVDFEEDISKTVGSKVIGYFAYAIDKHNELAASVYWTKEQCLEHSKKYSKAKGADSVWNKEFDKMAMKTAIKNLCSLLKTTPEIENAIKLDQLVFGGEKEKDKYLDNPRTKNGSTKTTVNNHIPEIDDFEEAQADDVEFDINNIETPF